MTNPAALVSDSGAEIRWREWQARGVTNDRRTAKNMRRMVFLLAAGCLAWFVVQLA